jgi:hypothetical protein
LILSFACGIKPANFAFFLRVMIFAHVGLPMLPLQRQDFAATRCYPIAKGGTEEVFIAFVALGFQFPSISR